MQHDEQTTAINSNRHSRNEISGGFYLGNALGAAIPHHVAPSEHQRDADHGPHEKSRRQPHSPLSLSLSRTEISKDRQLLREARPTPPPRETNQTKADARIDDRRNGDLDRIDGRGSTKKQRRRRKRWFLRHSAVDSPLPGLHERRDGTNRCRRAPPSLAKSSDQFFASAETECESRWRWRGREKARMQKMEKARTPGGSVFLCSWLLMEIN